ncbi:Undecaprenyl phosphate N,N'-diacetylbacillosamine 1-phosphate transferase [bioreactor metagenome]|uniref:Undecaprenyl phosphate N,N'-diacetylbacillosamine 1-phosphate transferase n=1 Tax=bioreactor metagenome TaxID=1076179 RepID=A0A644WV00_9ZZZZ
MDNINTSNQQIEITYKATNKVGYNAVKRLADIVLSLISIVLLSPIFIIVAIVIRFDSKGKIVFGQNRIGKDMKEFRIYKFRTMYENSEEIFKNFTEEQKNEYYINFKLDNDPRITKVGGFLRKTSLDELPQLINILKGDMSIVGPRPIVEKEIEKYGSYAEAVFSILPGLTGYWQANGRSDTTYDERVKMDMYYIKNRSLLMDIKIILKTFISVIKKEGAV